MTLKNEDGSPMAIPSKTGKLEMQQCLDFFVVFFLKKNMLWGCGWEGGSFETLEIVSCSWRYCPSTMHAPAEGIWPGAFTLYSCLVTVLG